MPERNEPVDRRGGWSEAAEEVRAHLRSVTLADVLDARVAGFALALAWQLVVYFSATVHFSTRNDVTHFNSVLGFSSLGMVAVLVLAALAPRGFARVVARPWARLVAPAMVAAATVALSIVEHSEVIRQPWCSIASTLAGIGMGALLLSWAVVFSRFSTMQVIARAASALILAAIAFALVVLMPEPFSVVVAACAPMGSAAILFAQAPWQELGKTPSAQLRHGAFSRSAVLSLGVLALTGSFVSALLIDAAPIVNSGSNPWLFLFASVVAVSAVCVPMLSADSLDFAAAYKSSVFAMGLIFLLLPIVEAGGMTARLLGLTVYCLTLLLAWVVLARITDLYQLPPLFAFGVGWSSLVLGNLAGTFAGGVLESFIVITPWLLSVCTLAGVCLLFFAYLFLFTEKTMARLLGGPPSRGKRPFKERCHQVALDYALTDREEEVMILIAKGRSTPRIRAELGLTTGTVNTHLANLYRKLDVHDRQEVIDRVEGARGGKEL